MNIFAVHLNPQEAARRLPDQHVVKMPLEAAQMLCGLMSEHDIMAPWSLGAQHAKHPVYQWLRFDEPTRRGWLIQHALELCAEHGRRFPNSNPLKALGVIRLADAAFRRRGMATDGVPSSFGEAFSPEFPADSHRLLLRRRGLNGVELTIELYRAYMDFKRIRWAAAGHPMRYGRSPLPLDTSPPWRV